MYKMCKTEQSALRQRELERWLLTAMSSQHYDEISVSDLCTQIGVPRKSFYRYFSGKEGALHALIDHTLMEFESYNVFEKTGEKRDYRQDLERFFRFWESQKLLLDALARSSLSGVLIERSVEHALSAAGTPLRFLRQEEKTAREYATRFGVCGLMSMILAWHMDGFRQEPRLMSAIAIKLLMEPLFSDGR